MTFELLFLIPNTTEEWREWFGDNGINVVGIIIGLIVVRWLVARVISRVIRAAALRAGRARLEDDELVERRVNTLLSTLGWLFTIFLSLVGIALILDQFDIQISALLAGVGVVGIAVGLGAQTLIKDVINGLFILVEGQYAVGDVVQVAGVSGQVIEITPRRTVLRDQNGHVHVVPNSAITVATNMTQGFSRINLNVTVAYEEDIERVTTVINEICEKLAADFPMDIIVAPKVLRVDALGADGIDIKILGDVKVFKQWDLMGELRRRLKARFDEEGIEIPYHREVQVPFAGPLEARSSKRDSRPPEEAD
jgi:small conductance mechanosensitive channel